VLLEIQSLTSGYGKGSICHAISLEVGEKELVCMLGRNGVGKSTLLRAIIGILPVQSGRILLDGEDISCVPDHQRARRGIGYVPQGRLVFAKLTVAENLRSGTIIGGSRLGPMPEDTFAYFPILKERLKQQAGTLSGGEQQMLAIARALAGKPRLLLLDEPSEGVQPSIVQEIRRILRQISVERSLAMLLVEQNLKFAAGLAERGYVIEKGRIVASGAMDQLMSEDVVTEHLTFA
jgi:urea ABC transporter ATP-binding protein UrtE